jgi:hypothetical protein
MSLSDEKQQVVTVNVLLILKEKVAHKQICPVRGPLQQNETGGI